MKLTFKPLTPDAWSDFEALFGERGACGGCWCMWWRLGASEFQRSKGARNRASMKRLVRSGQTPGILAYHGREAVGWCAVAPRDEYPRLDRSRVLKPLDDKPVWSITCLFVAKHYRRKGVMVALLKEARRFVKKQGGKIVEGYPVDPRKGEMPDVFAYTGIPSAFEKAGFEECARRSDTRPIMRTAVSR